MKFRGKTYQDAMKQFERAKLYEVDEALELVKNRSG